MSNYLMASQMGMSIVGGWADFQTAKIQADLQSKIQSYRDTMQKLSAARSLNAVTVNEVRTRDAEMSASDLIQRTALKDQGRAEVNAAAAGVAGNSVDMVARDLKASAGRATYAQRRQANQQLSELGAQRTSIAIATITGSDTQVIPRPSVGSLLLGAGTNLLGIYDSHQPEGDRIIR